MAEAPAPPARLATPGAASFLAYAGAVALVVWSFEGAGWSLDRLAAAPPSLADFLARAWPPATDNLARLGWRMVETLQIALTGTILGVALALPCALLAARKLVAGRSVNAAMRVALGFLRAVPDIAWALLFVVAVGLGPFAGMLAIMVDTLGFCGRFFADDMESADRGPAEALTATGARRLDVVACATVPAAMPAFISTALYALEKSVRSSTILGLVGAGGIGMELKVAFDLFDYPTALTIIGMIAIVVIAVEQAGLWARTRIIGAP